MDANAVSENPPEESNPYKQRFKGVENFLRRVAFNLGNSPSQTEVKIISCIPIDVTDLQAKIISLQRQLHDVKNNNASAKSIPGQNTSINPSVNTKSAQPCICSGANGGGPLDNAGGMTIPCDNGSCKDRKSTVSFLFPSQSSVGFQRKDPFKTTTSTLKQSPKTSGHQNFFGRAKKKKIIVKKLKPKTQLVYYAQTQNGPFYNYRMRINDEVDDNPEANIEDVLSKSYLANVVQRHFDPERAVDEFSDTSNFTSPVCRDFSNNGYCLYESDVCSCCHGQFQNVDKYIGKTRNYIIDPIATNLYRDLNKNIYYDSNYYDVVPVKEKAHKIPKDNTLKRELKRQVDMRCCPENLRTKSYHYGEVENHTKPLTYLKNDRKLSDHLKNTKNKTTTKSLNGVKENKVDKEKAQYKYNTNTSNSCCVDYSEIYRKSVNKTEKPPTLRPKFHQNEECLTIDVRSDNLAITRSIQIDLSSTENKTEDTLNQIKSILQSVLAEVKTNSQINNSHESKSKKDAITQKGPSQSNSFAQNFNYNNSYSDNPFITTCSRQIPSNLCYTNIPCQRIKYTQHFPLLIHAPGHQNCRYLYKSSGHTSRPVQKQAATTATNTDAGDQENRATEKAKLIKEIYKSIVPSIDFPKETSNSEVDIRSVTKELINISNFKDIKESNLGISNVQKRDIQIEATMTPLTTTTTKSKDNISSDTRSDTKKIETYLHYKSQSTETDKEAVGEPCNRTNAAAASTVSEHDSEDLSTEEENEAIVNKSEVEFKTEKKGLLQRVLESVKLFNKKKRNGAAQSIKRSIKNRIELAQCGSDSDSDDYQTIYSENINNSMHQQNNRRHYRPKLHITHKSTQQRANRRSPYMEQELRREWNERLTFRENRGKRYSSERPYSDQNQPPYRQNYETRCAMIDHSSPCHRDMYRDNPVQNVYNKVDRMSPINVVNQKYDNKKTKDKFVKETHVKLRRAVEKVYTRKLIK